MPTRRLLRAASLLLVLAVLVPAEAARAASTPWSGYRIKPAATADGGFMGARLTNGKVTYRLDAGARGRAAGYRAVHRVEGRRGIARAAWILSKYGDERIADQAAAVDVATYALVSHRRLSGPRARARLRQTGNAVVVRELTRYLLDESAKYAGPYLLRVRASTADVGDEVNVSARVLSHAGLPVAGLPVVLRLPGGVTKTRETSVMGRVSTSFSAERPGLHPVGVTVKRVPEWRLLVREPRRARASRIAVAGRKTTLAARVLAAVRAKPAVRLPTTVGRAQVGKGFTTTFTVTGSEGSSARATTASLHGPYPQGAAPDCSTGAARAARTQVVGDGTFRTPALSVAKAGVYFWKVAVDGNQVNAPAETCGAPFRVRTTPRIGLDAKPGSRLTFTLSGLPDGYDDRAVLRLFGPYRTRENASCGPRKKLGETTVRVYRNGAYTSARIATAGKGFYTWRVELAAGYLTMFQRTPCGAAGSFVKVT